jgi:hypothetical protein
VGITAADFITKPVRLDELLDWLGVQLHLQWQATPPAPPPEAAPQRSTAQGPPRSHLSALQQVVNLGYPRGVQQRLDDIEQQHPECKPWLAPLRELAQRFQFDRMTPLIQDALHGTPAD